jgi:hypothetical protein
MKTILNSLALVLIAVSVSAASDKTVIRVGHFPNITHAQGFIAHNLSRQDKGWFEARLGPGVEIQWFTYNADPSAMEAIFAACVEAHYFHERNSPCVGAGVCCQFAESRLHESRAGYLAAFRNALRRKS